MPRRLDRRARLDRERASRLLRTAHARRPPAAGMLGGPGGEPVAVDVLACADLAGRTGCRDFELGYVRDEPGLRVEDRGWYARATFRGARISVEQLPGPSAAARAFARRILDGGRCQHCEKPMTTDPACGWADGTTLIDGRTWPAGQQQAADWCVWHLDGVRWRRGCEQ